MNWNKYLNIDIFLITFLISGILTFDLTTGTFTNAIPNFILIYVPFLPPYQTYVFMQETFGTLALSGLAAFLISMIYTYIVAFSIYHITK